jgi:MinD superfamily P-loop ATPase
MKSMADVPKTELELMIEQEAKELKEAPVIKPIIGQVMRCHICGQCFSAQDLKTFETMSTHRGSVDRVACPNCHPQRGTL